MELRNEEKAHKVIIYSTPSCMYCRLAKDFFKEKGVSYTEYDVQADVKKREEMFAKTGQMGVPVIDIDGQIIIGFDERTLARALGV